MLLFLWPFKVTTALPFPKVKYFFLKAVIVACLYVLAFQDQTPSQSEIFSVIVDCSVCIGLSRPNTNTYEQGTITENISEKIKSHKGKKVPFIDIISLETYLLLKLCLVWHHQAGCQDQ